MKDPTIPQFVLNSEQQIEIAINEPQKNDIPSFTLNPETKITLQIPQTQAQIADQGYTYNQAGITYNQAGVLYGGAYLANQDISPKFFNDIATLPNPSISSIIDIKGGTVTPPPASSKNGPGFLMYVNLT